MENRGWAVEHESYGMRVGRHISALFIEILQQNITKNKSERLSVMQRLYITALVLKRSITIIMRIKIY